MLQLPTGGHTCTPADYVQYFKAKNVTCVVRLNKPHYDRNVFVAAGIKHVDMYYPDGSIPPEETLQKFLRVRFPSPPCSGHCCVTILLLLWATNPCCSLQKKSRVPWRCTAKQVWAAPGRASARTS